ncbi:MAG: hypothetical protein WCK32_02535 [Chlorobiaceae bacterium]
MNNETIKIFGTDWAAALQGIGTVIAVAISLWSLFSGRKAEINANRSAKAAEKSAEAAEVSAKEVERARKIEQSDILRPHFENIQYLWDVLFRKVVREERKVKLGQQAIDNVKAMLSPDKELFILLDRLLVMVNYVKPAFLESIESTPLPEDAQSNFDVFEQKRREYLSIR